MIKVIQHINLIPMFIAAIYSLKSFGLKWPLAFRFFSALLILALFTEILARLWAFYPFTDFAWQHPRNNAWIFSLSFIPQYTLFLMVYYHSIDDSKFRKILLSLLISFSFFAIFNFCFWQKMDKINSYTHLFSSCMMILVIFYYFEQLRRSKTIVKLSQQPMVWISSGAFAYHLLSIPFLVSLNFLNSNYLPVARLFFNGYQIFIFISYILYIKAFLCPQPQQK